MNVLLLFLIHHSGRTALIIQLNIELEEGGTLCAIRSKLKAVIIADNFCLVQSNNDSLQNTNTAVDQGAERAVR